MFKSDEEKERKERHEGKRSSKHFWREAKRLSWALWCGPERSTEAWSMSIEAFCASNCSNGDDQKHKLRRLRQTKRFGAALDRGPLRISTRFKRRGERSWKWRGRSFWSRGENVMTWCKTDTQFSVHCVERKEVVLSNYDLFSNISLSKLEATLPVKLQVNKV